MLNTLTTHPWRYHIKTQNQFILTLLATALVSGCAGTVKSLEPTGYANQYEVQIEGASIFTMDGDYLEAIDQAKAKCRELGQNYHKLGYEYFPPGFSRWPKTSLTFECNNNIVPTNLKTVVIDSKDIAQKLQKLDGLYKQNLITKEEYQSRRNQVLDDNI